MSEDVYVISLRRAAEIHGSTQGLASALRVPESTLKRWMSGRAMMPEQAFNRVLESIIEHEARDRAPPTPSGERSDLSFRVEDLFARCRKCGGAAFSASAPARLADSLECLACGEQIVHRDLLVELAQRAASRRRDRAAVRKKAVGRRGVQPEQASRAVEPGGDAG